MSNWILGIIGGVIGGIITGSITRVVLSMIFATPMQPSDFNLNGLANNYNLVSALVGVMTFIILTILIAAKTGGGD